MFTKDIYSNTISRPFLFIVLFSVIEFTNRVAVEGSLISLNKSVIVIDPYYTIIVRDRKGEDFSVKLLFALYSSVELDNTSYGASYTISILSICNFKSRGVVLHLVYKERKVYLVSYDEKGGIIDATDKRIELIKLLIY